jgi:hypothetical protein
MQTLQIDETKAKKLYRIAGPEFKEMLHDTFGEKFFQEKITDRVKTFEDACEVLELDPKNAVGVIQSPDSKSIAAYAKLCINSQGA